MMKVLKKKKKIILYNYKSVLNSETGSVSFHSLYTPSIAERD